MDIYTVAGGDTIQEIARIYGVTPESIIEVNGLTQPENLVTGMNLVIPVATPTTSRFKTYVVQPNDTLWSISKKHQMSLAQLIGMNNITLPYTAYAGQSVNVLQLGNPIETLGYLNPGITGNPAALVQQIGPSLTYLGYFEFPITPTGEVQGTLNEDVLNAARQVNTSLLPVLTNIDEEGFNSDTAHEALANTTNRQNLISNALALLNQYNLTGLIIDFENLYPEDRNLFTQFIQELAAALHQQNKILILNLAAKWEDQPDRPWVGFLDYSALGPLVDRAAIMTYEWGYVSGPPQATAPLPNVIKVLNYAIANNIPADKILMGMTLYGYDWTLPDTPENTASSVTQPQVWNLARQYNAVINFDNEAGQPYMNYTNAEGTRHMIWFEDAKSHYLKYQLVAEYGLKGVFYWIISQPFPATYYMVRNLFGVVKL